MRGCLLTLNKFTAIVNYPRLRVPWYRRDYWFYEVFWNGFKMCLVLFFSETSENLFCSWAALWRTPLFARCGDHKLKARCSVRCSVLQKCKVETLLWGFWCYRLITIQFCALLVNHFIGSSCVASYFTHFWIKFWILDNEMISKVLDLTKMSKDITNFSWRLVYILYKRFSKCISEWCSEITEFYSKQKIK